MGKIRQIYLKKKLQSNQVVSQIRKKHSKLFTKKNPI